MGKKKRAKQENRAFTDSYVSALLTQATGEALAASTAAREICAGLYERAFASARIEPDTPETRALSVEALGMIGRAFIHSGEAIFSIDADPTDGEVRVTPASSWDVRGSVEPETWNYKANFAGPEVTVTRTLSGASVLHFKYAVDAGRPWKGLSPMQLADVSTKIEQGVSRQLADETGRSSGYVGFVPVGLSDTSFNDMKTTIPNMRGKMILAEAGGNWDALNQGNRPGLDVQRVGADPPAVIVAIWQYAVSLTLAACGVPIELLNLADGTGNRESLAALHFQHD